MVPWRRSSRSEQSELPPASPKRPPVGYIIATKAGPVGSQGVGYDYVMAADGLYVQSENDWMTARIHLAPTEVRGLAAAEKS